MEEGLVLKYCLQSLTRFAILKEFKFLIDIK